MFSVGGSIFFFFIKIFPCCSYFFLSFCFPLTLSCETTVTCTNFFFSHGHFYFDRLADCPLFRTQTQTPPCLVGVSDHSKQIDVCNIAAPNRLCVMMPHQPGTILNINRHYTSQNKRQSCCFKYKKFLPLYITVDRHEMREEERMEDMLLLHRNAMKFRGGR